MEYLTNAIQDSKSALHRDTDGFYSWTARDGRGHGSCGVTDEPGRASMRLNDALDALAPGASGSVRLVRLDRHARQPSYIHGKVLLRIRRDRTEADQ
ncbi:hypothetical protein ABZ897_61560 [Nonomuraea sp. NPDC046802]|uniref:hypothetical protein n=1 Tax=Nonomuraea sp. NPDC046802 TaxID=3154919 RepID=UPI0033FED05D